MEGKDGATSEARVWSKRKWKELSLNSRICRSVEEHIGLCILCKRVIVFFKGDLRRVEELRILSDTDNPYIE